LALEHKYEDDFQKAKSFASDYLNNCRLWRDYFNGDHWIHVPNVASEAAKPEINYIKPNVMQLLAMLQLKHPSILVNPAKKENMPTAELLSTALKGVYENKDVAEDVKRATLDMLIYSRGYQGIYWDAQDEGGRGAINSYTVSPFNMFVDPLAHTLDEAEYCHVKHLRSPFYVFTKYGVEMSEDAKDEFTNAEGIEVVESWYNPDKTLPNGRHIIWAVSDPNHPFVDEEIPYSFCRIPIVDYVVDDTSTGERRSMVGELWGTQKAFMKTLGYLLDNLMLTQNCQWKSKDTDLPDHLPNEPGYVHKTAFDLDALLTPPLSPQWQNTVGMLQSLMPDISGVRQVNYGATSGGVTAASAIVALQEAGKTIKEIKMDGVQRGVGLWGLMAVELMRWYTAEHWADIAGAQPDPAQMDSIYDVSITYSEALPSDKEMRLNLGNQFVNMKVIDPVGLGELTGDPVFIGIIDRSQARMQKAAQAQMQAAAQMTQQGGTNVPTQNPIQPTQ
jgi:hypothetical protein